MGSTALVRARQKRKRSKKIASLLHPERPPRDRTARIKRGKEKVAKRAAEEAEALRRLRAQGWQQLIDALE